MLNDNTMTSKIQDFSMTSVIKRFKCVQPICLHCHVAFGGGGGWGLWVADLASAIPEEETRCVFDND